MKKNVNVYQFIDAFQTMNRENQFSYEGKKALYDYEIELEDCIGNENELDVIGLCCDYTEYENLIDYNEEYNQDFETVEEIEELTTVIYIYDYNENKNGSFIIRNY